jgi:hypothetical protein
MVFIPACWGPTDAPRTLAHGSHWGGRRMATVRTGMKRLLGCERDLSALVIDGDFEMAEKCHAEKAYRHMAVDVDGDVDVARLGRAHAQRPQRGNREPDRPTGGFKFPFG